MPSQTRFGHHPDPATDFEIEVESLESIVTDKSLGLRTDEPWPVERIRKAMEFRVGGVESCVAAKQTLRKLEEKVSDATKPSQTSSQGSDGEVEASRPAADRSGALRAEPAAQSQAEPPAADAEHTPGPWIAAPFSSVVGAPVVASPSGRSICKVTYFDLGEAFANHDRESAANARLIAAAPELLEALKICLAVEPRALKKATNLAGQSPYDIGLAAVRKALGQHLGGEGL